jgi:uncharacterized membrane protein
LLLVGALLVALPPGQAAAKSYYIDRVTIDATVQPDGSMRMHERREFVFNGSFSFVIQDIVLTGPEGSRAPVAISEIVVSEGTQAYRQAASGAGTYSVVAKGERVEVTWRFAATDQRRTFDLTYVLSNPVMAHADVAELRWNFIGPEWEVNQNNVRVNLNLPPGAGAGEVRGWGHGPLAGQVDVTPTKVTWTIGQLRPSQGNENYLEGRVVFPLELVPGATRKTGQARLQAILAEEQRWANQANRARLLATVGVAVGALVLVGSIVLALWMQMRYGKEHRPEFEGDYYRELPGDYSPAEAGSLINFGTVDAKEITATILDLARRGYLTIEVTSEERRVLGGLLGTRQETSYVLRPTAPDEARSGDRLREHERHVLDFLFRQVALGRGEMDFDEIKAYAKRNPVAMQAFRSKFVVSATGTKAAESFMDQHTERIKTYPVVGGVGLFLAGVGLSVMGAPAAGVPMSVGGLVLVLGGAFLRRRSQLGSTHLAMWRAFRRFLQHFSSLDRAEVPSLIIWEHYLVYAVVLGVAKEVIDQLKLVYPQITEAGRTGFFPWLWLHPGAGANFAPGNMIAGLTESLQSSIATAVNYRPSSGGGRGGGFSGGGGFGGGGGGGGGRAG